MATEVNTGGARAAKVVVATSVMLSFISFWRAAAIVLNDLGSSAYYAGGIAEHAVGHAAPWFILGVMLFSYAVRAVYVESCGMFTRGGVYRVVKTGMGGTLAKLSVSALMFDYILTGPISGVSAGQYIIGLIAEATAYLHHPWSPSKTTINLFSAGIALVITLYFWWRNIKGIHESSEDALKIMYVTTVMVVLLIAWCGLTIILDPSKQRLPPAPVATNLHFNSDAVGWMPKVLPGSFRELRGESAPATSPEPENVEPEHHYGLIPNAGALIGLIGIFMAFGHSFLAMSGEESLAQVNRELEYPKHKNLMRAGFVIFVYSLLFTSLVSFFAYAIIPDHVRPQYYDNLISGISMYLAGPTPLKLVFQAFIVIVGFLMLAGAVNTAIIGSNGVLNRVSEDGVLADWFREPHKKFGTSHRIINMVAILQLATILISRGDVYVLGEAYAFGVVWSFSFNGLAMLVLRFKDKSHREWKVPFNINYGSTQLPLGLLVVTLILFAVAFVNIVTKEIATISGIAFTVVFYIVFTISERYTERKRGSAEHVEMDQFQLAPQSNLTNDTAAIRPGNTLCFVRDYNSLDHLRKALELTDTNSRDLVVMTVKIMKGPNTGYEGLSERDVFSSYKQLLFSRVVALAERAGKPVRLLVVPSSSVVEALARTAAQLQSREIIVGRSYVLSKEEQVKRFSRVWEQLPATKPQMICLRIVEPDGAVSDYNIGAQPPKFSTDEVRMIHDLWLDATQEKDLEYLDHEAIVATALSRMEEAMKGTRRAEVLSQIKTVAANRRSEESSKPDGGTS